MSTDLRSDLGTISLPHNFRKLTARQKLNVLSELLELHPKEIATVNPGAELIDLADVMVESAVGVMPVPLGIAAGITIDGHSFNVPMATEEPSVVAAATYAGRLLGRIAGGIQTSSSGQVMTAQVAIDNATADAVERIAAAEPQLRDQIDPILAPMTRRGGGYRSIRARWLDEAALLVVRLHVDTRDAMGANIINTAAEALRAPLEQLTGGRVLMAILTNAAPRRHACARFSTPVGSLPRRGEVEGAQLAHRIVRANEFATHDPERAVTHNKGIMNGVSAVALATGNDTRAIEAAAHAYASRTGNYRALTEYWIADGYLHASLDLPMAVGTVGGAVGFHPATGLALKILFSSVELEVSAEWLGRVAVALGLAQNFAAISALVAEGIQHGHMRQHARRLAWKAGARDARLQQLAEQVWQGGVFNIETARALLTELEANPDT